MVKNCIRHTSVRLVLLVGLALVRKGEASDQQQLNNDTLQMLNRTTEYTNLTTIIPPSTTSNLTEESTLTAKLVTTLTPIKNDSLPEDISTFTNSTTTMRSPLSTSSPIIKTLEANIGSSISLTCPIKRENISVTWYKLKCKDIDHRVLLTSGDISSVYSLQSVTLKDEGTYQCVTNVNQDGEIIANIMLTIASKDSKDEGSTSPLSAPGTTDGLPHYIGLAIGLGICIGLLLLSGGAVFLLNFSSSGGLIYCLNTVCGPSSKEDANTMSRIQVDRHNSRASHIKVLPIQRMHISSAHDV